MLLDIYPVKKRKDNHGMYLFRIERGEGHLADTVCFGIYQKSGTS
jgi:hypothetical protein